MSVSVPRMRCGYSTYSKIFPTVADLLELHLNEALKNSSSMFYVPVWLEFRKVLILFSHF